MKNKVGISGFPFIGVRQTLLWGCFENRERNSCPYLTVALTTVLSCVWMADHHQRVAADQYMQHHDRYKCVMSINMVVDRQVTVCLSTSKVVEAFSDSFFLIGSSLIR
jgi:hypothetical protein